MLVKSGEALAEQQTPGIVLPSPFFEILGRPAPNFSLLLYGRPGSGKSTFAVGLCRVFLPYVEREGQNILYCSAEEGVGGTTGERFARLGASSPDIAGSNYTNIEELRQAIEWYDAQLVVIDSVSHIDPRTSKAQKLVRDLHEAGRASVMIAHQNSKGKPKMANDLEHGCYVVLQCEETTLPVSEARRWGLDVDDSKRQVQDDEAVAHVARSEKNRYGAERQSVPIPMKESEIRESVPPRVIDASIRELEEAGRWPPKLIASGNDRARPEAASEPETTDEAGPTSMQVKANPGKTRSNYGAGEPAASGPETAGNEGGGDGNGADGSSSGSDSGADSGARARADAADAESTNSRSTDSQSTDSRVMSDRVSENPSPSRSPSQEAPAGEPGRASGPKAVRVNPVDLSEKQSFTLEELIENNGNAARSISYLNRFIGWERGCVAEVSENDVPGYRDENGGTVRGKGLLSFTYERFGKTSARPRPVAVVRMYLNDQLEATFCAETARECIEQIKDDYGSLQIRVESQQHLKEALGAEEYRRLESDIPLTQDRDRETMPEEIGEAGPEQTGFDSEVVSPRGHINVEQALVDQRVINLVVEAAEGNLPGASADDGEVLGEDLTGSGASQRVRLFGETYYFFVTTRYDLERATGKVHFVGDPDALGSSERAEELLAFNFGMETESEPGTDREMFAHTPATAEESSEARTEEDLREEDISEVDVPEAEESGDETLDSAIEVLEERASALSLEEEEVGYYVLPSGPGSSEERERAHVDSKLLRTLQEIADTSTELEIGDPSSSDFVIRLRNLELRAFEAKTTFKSSGPENPAYQLTTGGETEPVRVGEVLAVLEEEGVAFQNTEAAFSWAEPTGSAAPDKPSEEESLEEESPEEDALVEDPLEEETSEDEPPEEKPPEEEPHMLMSVDERISTLAEDAADHPSAPGAYGHSGGEILVGLDAREILRDVADHTFVGRVRIETEEGDLKFAFEVAPMKYVRSPDNEARRLYADNEPAEELSVRALVQALSETGALTLEEVTTRTESSETAGEPAEPPAATEPATPEPAATDPAASEPGAEDPEEMSEDIQEIQSGLSELTSALEDL